MTMNASNAENYGAGEQSNGFYDSSYYAGQLPGALQSARVILGILFEICHPQSVFDLGCGQGAWLAAAEELGCTSLAGADGPWVDRAMLMSKNIDFSSVNLEDEFRVSERFDLCISVEVAEHLSPRRAQAFVETLCALSDLVVFSAAIRMQGGINHINEQRQSFWAEHFNALSYECFDLFRPLLWSDRRIESWYRQNVLLYVKSSHPVAHEVQAKILRPGPLDIVHPEIYEGNLETYMRAFEEPTLRFCCGLFGRWGGRQLRKILPRGARPATKSSA